MRRFGILAFALLGAGCAAVGPTELATTSAFNEDELDWYKKGGANTIKGNAVLRTVGGEVRTCAGLSATLMPVSRYAEERFNLMYGPGNRGYAPANRPVSFKETSAQYVTFGQETQCDSAGNFTFRNLADGEYFVTALVTWGVPQKYFTSTEGGRLMQRITVSGGELKEVVLTLG